MSSIIAPLACSIFLGVWISAAGVVMARTLTKQIKGKHASDTANH